MDSKAVHGLDHLSLSLSKPDPEFLKSFEEVNALPIDDAHCRIVTDRDAFTTSQRFLERMSLAGYPVPAYFPAGVYNRWLNGDAATRHILRRQLVFRKRST